MTQNLNPHIDADRTIFHTVHTDDGHTEIYWGRANDDFAFDIEGSLLFHHDGSFTWKATTNEDVPIVVTIGGNRVIVSADEDQFPLTDRLGEDEKYVAFDSTKYNPGDLG